MSDQKRENPLIGLLVGFGLGAIAGGIAMGAIGSSSVPSPSEVQAKLDAERTEAFVAGLCLDRTPCEGRLLIKAVEAPLQGDLRITMNRLYSVRSGDLAIVPPACTNERDVMGNSCKFVPDKPAVTVYNPATAVE